MKDSLIEAEKWWEQRIEQVFNELYDECLWSIKKMAELSIILREREKANLDNKNLSIFYVMLQAKIFQWCDNLNNKEYNEFCKLSGTISQIEEKLSKKN